MPAFEFVTEILRPYLDESAPQKKPRTVETDRGAGKVLEEFFRGLWLGPQLPQTAALLTRRTVKAAVRELQGELSDSRIHRVVAVGSAACNYAAREWSYDIANPFANQLRPGARKRERYVSTAEERALALVAGPWLRGMIAFALATGLRVTEQLELTWDRVRGDELVFRPEDQKSGRDRRRALNATALLVLERQPRAEGCDYVFHVDGEPVKRRTLHDLWTAARERAGIDDLIWHDLRRTCGQRMLEAGATIAEVQAQLGHEDSKTTERNYTTPSVMLAKQGVARLRGGILDGVEDDALSA